MAQNDPIGKAIEDFAENPNQKHEPITVEADLCDNDVLPLPYLFRTYSEMPAVEQTALQGCAGKILDIGAGTGCHSLWLKNNNQDITALDYSPGACKYMRKKGLNVLEKNIWQLEDQQYDTLLLLMNGVGLAGRLSHLSSFLNHLKKMLTPTGKILIDSSDISYLYKEEDGSYWMDLNAHYFGEFQFKMQYKKSASEWFEWLYVDAEKFEEKAKEAGLTFQILTCDDDHYLVELKKDLKNEST